MPHQSVVFIFWASTFVCYLVSYCVLWEINSILCTCTTVQPIVIAELKSFVQELKTQLTTLYHQFAPLPVPPADDEQLREKLNRLYIGASSEQKASGDSVSSGLSSTLAGETSYSCTASQPSGEEEGQGQDVEALPHSGVSVTNEGASTVVSSDMHVSDWCCADMVDVLYCTLYIEKWGSICPHWSGVVGLESTTTQPSFTTTSSRQMHFDCIDLWSLRIKPSFRPLWAEP